MTTRFHLRAHISEQIIFPSDPLLFLTVLWVLIPFFPPAQKGHSCGPLAFRLYANKSTDPNPVIERSDLRCPAAPRWKPSSVRTNTRCWYRCVHVQLCLWGDAAVSSWVCSNLSGTKIKPCFLQRFCDEDDDGDDEDEGFINLLNSPVPPPPCCGVLTARLNSNSRLSYANDLGELRPTNGCRWRVVDTWTCLLQLTLSDLILASLSLTRQQEVQEGGNTQEYTVWRFFL